MATSKWRLRLTELSLAPIIRLVCNNTNCCCCCCCVCKSKYVERNSQNRRPRNSFFSSVHICFVFLCHSLWKNPFHLSWSPRPFRNKWLSPSWTESAGRNQPVDTHLERGRNSYPSTQSHSSRPSFPPRPSNIFLYFNQNLRDDFWPVVDREETPRLFKNGGNSCNFFHYTQLPLSHSVSIPQFFKKGVAFLFSLF